VIRARTEPAVSREIDGLVKQLRAGIQERAELRMRRAMEAGTHLTPDPDPAPAAPMDPALASRSENDADWRRRASVPWPSGTR